MSAESSAVSRLKKSIETGMVSHAYLFAGAGPDARMKLAKDVIKTVMCDAGGCGTCAVCRKIENGNHMDIKYVEGRSGKKLLTEDIEDMLKFLSRRPYEADRNIVVITKADNIDKRAEKKLLKTLEEPAPGTIIILLADNLSGIDQTIRSRCVIYRLPEGEKNYSQDTVRFCKALVEAVTTDTGFAKKRELVENIAQAHKKNDEIDLAEEILECLEEQFMERIKEGRTDCLDSVSGIEEAKKMLKVNVKVTAVFMDLLLEAEENRW